MTIELAATTADISPADARVLTDRIKVGVEAIWQLIEQAYVTRAWAALGYSSWDDYCTREFGTSRLRLPREERQEVVASMRESGLSTRAIASATGLSKDTVHRELSAVSNETPAISPARKEPVTAPFAPATTTGTDGKTYAAAVPPAARRPPKKQTNIRAVIADALTDITRARNILTALTRTQLAAQDEEARRTWATNLSESIEALTGFTTQLTSER